MRNFLYLPIFLLVISCTELETDNRVAELEREVNELRSQIEHERSRETAPPTPHPDESNHESYDILRGLLDEEPRNLSAEITNRSFKTDANFNEYTELTVANNYSKTIRSIRIGSRLVDSYGGPNTPSFRNSRKEIIHVTIPPGQSRSFKVTRLSGMPHQFYIDGITFTDGTSRN
jgi:hypothetical protein